MLLKLKEKLKNGEKIAFICDLDNTLYTSKTLKEEAFKALAWTLADLMSGKENWPQEIDQAREKAIKVVEEIKIDLKNSGKYLSPGASDIREVLGIHIHDYKVGKEKYYCPENHIKLDHELKNHFHSIKEKHPLIKFSVMTNQTNEMAKRILNILEIHHLFDVIMTQENTGLKKPNPEALKFIANKLEIPFENCISIGDLQEKDIDPALQIGMLGFLVSGPEDVSKFFHDLRIILEEIQVN
ncbi:MAG: HAD family hydrolase [Patescibacteria group bacterium]